MLLTDGTGFATREMLCALAVAAFVFLYCRSLSHVFESPLFSKQTFNTAALPEYMQDARI